jgi:hypothetical protein
VLVAAHDHFCASPPVTVIAAPALEQPQSPAWSSQAPVSTGDNDCSAYAGESGLCPGKRGDQEILSAKLAENCSPDERALAEPDTCPFIHIKLISHGPWPCAGEVSDCSRSALAQGLIDSSKHGLYAGVPIVGDSAVNRSRFFFRTRGQASA